MIFTSFGDMMRVPGSQGNLLEAKARGADVRFVYSPLDALRIASTTRPAGGLLRGRASRRRRRRRRSRSLRARRRGVDNFSVFCNHVTIVPPIKAILESPDLRLDGFLGPGHVSTVVGNRPYRFVPELYGKPLVTAGFEPLDILQAIAMLLAQIREGRCEVENQYTRCVRDEGNPRALARAGRGVRAAAALRVARARLHLPERPQAAARVRRLGRRAALLEVPGVRVADPKACQCGEVLKGVIKPWECKVFGTACTPETPIGTCMVSSEGACAAYYNFGRLHREAAALVGQQRAAARG